MQEYIQTQRGCCRVATEVGIRCDGCGYLGDTQRTAKLARAALKRVGWKNRGKVDTCRSCQGGNLDSGDSPSDRRSEVE